MRKAGWPVIHAQTEITLSEKYFRMCQKCGCETERYTSGACKPCHKLTKQKWYQDNKEKNREDGRKWANANPEKTKASQAKSRKKNAEKIKEKSAAYHMANREKRVADGRKWREENKERLKAMKDKYIAANPEKVKEQIAKWAKANPERLRVRAQNRRARILKSGGELSKNIGEKLFALQKGKCACCGEHLGDKYQLDHIVPVALGGSNTDDNIQLLRPICNRRKHAKHPVDYMQSKGFLL